jgi:Holliday junction resolvase RusA-like endonuclease
MLLFDVDAPLFRKEERQFNVVFFFTKKADLDNMVKFVLDIGNDVLYSDDEQVDIIHCEKRRVSSLNECKTTISIERR